MWDLIAIGVIVAAATYGSARFNLGGRLLDYIGQYGDHDLSWLAVIALLAPILTAFFSLRRWQDATTVHTELANLSLLDSLTGLPNRLFLPEWLEASLRHASRTNSHVGVMFIDLDRFKAVNDTHGHEVGDRLMVAAAQRLRTTLRPADKVVRYGGDEFVAICQDLPHSKAAERVAERIIAALEQPFEIGHDIIRISCSIGIAMTETREDDLEDVLRSADAAMYRAKGIGSGTYKLVDRNVRGAHDRAGTEPRMRRALENNEFVLYYQPVFDVNTRTIVGAEALLRWQDPQRGLIPPDQFIPNLEETGLIVEVGAWVLEQACSEAATWSAHTGSHRALTVNVNVAARQLGQANFADTVGGALHRAGLSPRLLCLEITESALLYDLTTAWAVLRGLEGAGVKVALDDFGTGFSSLTHLRHLQLDVLKIDRSFITGLVVSREDAAIVEHVIAMAEALGITTVAEGIEEEEQLEMLQRLGCHHVQGYLLGRPMPADDFRQLLGATDAPPPPVPQLTPVVARVERVTADSPPVMPRLRAYVPR